ncbi:ATP-dependent Clp protease ATP-binding subunit [Candidatus Deferrimicrobium sp.]|uniref:ATP-dependent Clp protease ATP-binding subunit n=1 Tax=Candidatus Deferrimicrobium sp. TaxID=3060586 RepID=UPI002EDA4284
MATLTKAARMTWEIGAAEAARLRHPFIEREHLLIGLCSLGKILQYLDYTRIASLPIDLLREEADGLERVLAPLGITDASMRRGVRSRLRPGNVFHTERVVHRSMECKRYFRRAGEIVKEEGEVAVRHLFAAVLEDPGPVISAVLAGAGISPGVLREKMLAGREPVQEPISVREEAGDLPVPPEPLSSETPLLDRYGRDITRTAREGRLLPFVDSDRTRNTLRQLIKVLMMPTKNNPVLVGEAGVGKTAIVEALAERIALGRDRRFLAGRRLVELSMADMVAGTKYRGEFEERLTRLIEEVRSHPEVILFIDEFHTVAGAGRAEGAPMDAGNIMKPALARGELRCIGATTITEYRRSVEKDPALERRFQPVQVAEPGRDETLAILQGVRAHRERHFGVTITDETLSATVELAVRFDPTHFLPDKAIDLLDRACAECRVPLLTAAANSDRYDAVGVAVVTPEYVARVVAEKMGIPIEVARGGLGGIAESRVRGLEEHLNRHLVGQEEAISRVCRRLVLSHAGLGDRRRPMGVFLFLGPSGVGKTEVARRIASYLFANERAFIHLDMSEFQEEVSVSRLIGASPGYVGYEEGGRLVARLRTTPYSVVLLDEVEKASPRVFDLFLQLFDEAKITDAQGHTADARHTIFIMTGNIPVRKEMGFLAGEAAVAVEGAALAEVRRRFRPEFLNRVDEQIVFRALAPDDVRKVLALRIAELSESLHADHGVALEMDPDAADWLAAEGYKPEYGVRELARAVDRWIRGPIGAMSAEGELARKAASGKPLKVRKTAEGLRVE